MRLLLVFVLAMVAGCSGMGSRLVSVVRDPGCFPDGLPGTWQMNMVDMPGFFAPIMDDGVSLVMRARGLQRVESGGDMVVTLAFERLDLSPQRPLEDPMQSGIDTDSPIEFMARVHVSASAGDTMFWSGTLARTHLLYGDETMHQPRATLAIVTAIHDLFVGFPVACDP